MYILASETSRSRATQLCCCEPLARLGIDLWQVYTVWYKISNLWDTHYTVWRRWLCYLHYPIKLNISASKGVTKILAEKLYCYFNWSSGSNQQHVGQNFVSQTFYLKWSMNTTFNLCEIVHAIPQKKVYKTVSRYKVMYWKLNNFHYQNTFLRTGNAVNNILQKYKYTLQIYSIDTKRDTKLVSWKLEKLEIVWKHSALRASCFHTISRFSNFHSCWYNCISTRKMFYIS